MTTTQIHPDIEELQGILNSHLLKAGDHKFAADLVHAYHKYGDLTKGQWPWVQVLIGRALNPPPPPVTVQVGQFAGVIALFNKAKETLKFPKIRLQIDGAPIILSLAGAQSKAPGTVNIMGEGTYPDRPWYGRVSPDGAWTPSKSVKPEFQEKLVDLLQKFSAHPSRVAKEYGKLTGNCCFCMKTIGDDPRSGAAGFGPVCAKKYGLYDEWKTAVKKAGIMDDELPVEEHVANGSLVGTLDTTSAEIKTTSVAKCMFCGDSTVFNLKGQPVCLICQGELGIK